MIEFPDPANLDGEIAAFGGDLLPSTLLSAYYQGIFPWYTDNEPITWWSLEPRFVLLPSNFRIPHRLVRSIRSSEFTLTIDMDFHTVIMACRNSARSEQNGTWITDDMVNAYCQLHKLGYAHSVEVWKGKTLAGGLYGVSLGGCFYGESMFFRIPDASKIAFAVFTESLFSASFGLIDCQQHTAHLERFGAVNVPRREFLSLLRTELKKPTMLGNWSDKFPHLTGVS